VSAISPDCLLVCCTSRLHLGFIRQTLRSPTADLPLISMRAKERIGQMTKNELITAVADKAQMTKTAAATAVVMRPSTPLQRR